MSKVRITSLVKAMNTVRHRLAEGIPASEAEAFRKYVTGIVAQTEELCRQNQISPNQLPAPSFHAYQYLKSLDLQDLPLIEGNPPPRGELRIRNLVSLCNGLHTELDRLAKQMAANPASSGQAERERILLKIQSQAVRIEEICKKAGGTTAALPLQSRRAYKWLRFLGDRANLDLHFATLASAEAVIQETLNRKPLPLIKRKRVLVALYPASYLYKAQRETDPVRILIHEGFLGAPQEVLRAILRQASGRGGKADHHVIREYAASDDYAEVVQAVEFTDAAPAHFTQGRQYNLEAIFNRINASYFRGRLDRPQLTWNRIISRRKFGHYEPASDTVMISITLDDPRVPEYVIELVMYHELLHKALGGKVINGRHYAHTREFREQERKFRHYAEGQEYLNQLAGGEAPSGEG